MQKGRFDRTARLQRIAELCGQLSVAVDSSFRVRELAEELKRATEELIQSTQAERRAVPRFRIPIIQSHAERRRLSAELAGGLGVGGDYREVD